MDARVAIFGSGLVLAGLAALVGCRADGDGAAPTAEPQTAHEAQTAATVRPFLERYCLECHQGDDPKGELSFAGVVAGADPFVALSEAREVHERVALHEMPPSQAPQPTLDERSAFLAAWELGLARRSASRQRDPIDPGCVTMRRLSRVEYVNTVRDLVGRGTVDAVLRLDDFPVDNLSHGFDNLGEALTLSPLHLEKYVAAAERIADHALPDPAPKAPPVQHKAAVRMAAPGKSGRAAGDAWFFFSGGEIHAPFVVPRDGTYTLRARAGADQAGPDVARMAFRVDGRALATVNVSALRNAPAVYATEQRLEAGTHRVGVGFTNDYYQPKDPDPGNRDRNLIVWWVEVVGPTDVIPLTPLAQTFRDADPGGDDVTLRARTILAPFVTRAFRHPLTAQQLDPFVGLVADAVADGETFHSGMRLAVTAVLASPRFLFRAEPPPADGAPMRALTDFELATRLSYFLWSSLPDDRLFALAAEGRLQDAAVRRSEVERLIGDTRASAFSENFAVQWLELRSLDDVAPDPNLFPEFDEPLRRSMRRETEMFVDAVLRERRPLRELLAADFTFIDGRLAKHYDLPSTGPDEPFRRRALRNGRRSGLLTHASVLTLTSNPDRTSPVKRGKWILENVLDDAPPPPPPEVGNLDESPEAVAGATLRERLMRHRADPSCATCHNRMDPLGFALESFGPLGRFRERDGQHPVEDLGELPDGREVRGAAGLRTLLSSEPRFLRCVVKKLLTFAVGRGLTPEDDVVVDRIVAGLPAVDPTFIDVIVGVVESPPFLQQGALKEDVR